MTEIVITKATLDDALELSFCLRQSDLDELDAATGRAPMDALFDGVVSSDEAWAARIEGGVVALWGVAAAPLSFLGPRIGIAWMLGSDLIDQHKESFIEACNQELPRLLRRWDVLLNAIDARNTKALRWAERMGFVLAEPAPMGRFGLPFVRFSVSLEDVNNVQSGRGCDGCLCGNDDVRQQAEGQL